MTGRELLQQALQHALTQPDKKEQRMTDEQISDWSYKMQIACNKSTSDSDINIIKLIQHIENLYEQGRADEREACAKIALKYEPTERQPYVTYAADEIRARGDK